jgi:hypothetical protein
MKQLASKFKNLSDDDLTTSGAFIQAIKKRSQTQCNVCDSVPRCRANLERATEAMDKDVGKRLADPSH